MIKNNHCTIKIYVREEKSNKKFYIKIDKKSAVESVKHENNIGKELCGLEPKLESPK